MDHSADGMEGMGGTMWGSGLLWIVIAVVLLLAIAALVKYLRGPRP